MVKNGRLKRRGLSLLTIIIFFTDDSYSTNIYLILLLPLYIHAIIEYRNTDTID